MKKKHLSLILIPFLLTMQSESAQAGSNIDSIIKLGKIVIGTIGAAAVASCVDTIIKDEQDGVCSFEKEEKEGNKTKHYSCMVYFKNGVVDHSVCDISEK
jgi:hypothetical protein